MLVELLGGYWENKPVRDPVLLVIQTRYADGVTWGDANGVLQEAMPGKTPGPACSCMWLQSLFPFTDQCGPEPVSAPTSTRLCFFNPAIPSRCPSLSDGAVWGRSCSLQSLS